MDSVSKSLKNTDALAREFLDSISKKSKKRATIVGLSGDLGSGKTTFVQCVAQALGVKERITSPTFVIMKRFKIKDLRFKHLVHIDAYRLKSGEELLKLGWRELASDPANLIFIEWPERMEEILPSGHLKIYFEFVDESTRKIGTEERIKK